MTARAAVGLLLLAAGAGAQEEGPTVVVEVVVRDGRQAPVGDLTADEIELRQDGAAQAVVSFQPSGSPGGYLVRYVPKSGQPGPVMLRVLRRGAVARGPDGGALKVRVEPALSPLERRLVAMRGSATPPRRIEHQPFVLRFERDGDKLHHTFVVDVPLAGVELRPAEALLRGSVGLMAEVKRESGELVQRFSLEYPVEADAPGRDQLLSERVVWMSHLHLPAGRYVLETTSADLVSAGFGVARLAFEAPPPAPGPSVSSLSVLAPGGALTATDTAADNPLRYEDRQLVPAFRRVFVAGGLDQLPFYVVVYPDPSRADPVQAALELYREGALVARGAIGLPAASGPIPYAGSFPVAKLPVGVYEMKVVVRQGAAIAQETATFEMVPPPRFQERQR